MTYESPILFSNSSKYHWDNILKKEEWAGPLGAKLFLLFSKHLLV